MAVQGYFAQTAQVGSVADKIIQKPNGSGVTAASPTIPAAVAQTAQNTAGGGLPYWTRTSTSVLVLNMPTAPGWTSSSKVGIFWAGTDGTPHYCLDCTCSISVDAVTITAPTLSATQLADGQTYFNAASTTGAGDVSGQYIHAGVTAVTFAVATIATADVPNNPDIVDYVFPVASIEQLLFTCQNTGAVEFIESGGPTVERSVNYTYPGNFYNYVAGVGVTLPWASGTVDTLRFYNSSMTAQVMSVAAVMA